MKKESTLSENQEYFCITSVCRDDLEELGYETSELADATMNHIADKLANAYSGSAFWADLDIIADHLEIPRKKTSQD